MKQTGFDRPFHPLQLATWVAYGVFNCEFCVFVAPFLPEVSGAWWIGTAVFALSSVCTFGFGWVCTGHNCADPYARRTWEQQESLGNFRTPKAPPDHPPDHALELCEFCNSFVLVSSKHCRACGRCVPDFDHHCKFLNNCINKGSYRSFIALLVSVLVMSVTVLVCNAAAIVVVVAGSSSDMLDAVEDAYGFTGSGLVPILAVPSLMACGFLVSVGELFLFHCYLIHRGMTTYEYILEGRAKEERKSKGTRASKSTKSQSANATPPV